MAIWESQDQVDIEPILAALSRGAEASAELNVRIAALLINKILPTIHDLGTEIKQLTLFEAEITDSLATIHNDVRQLSEELTEDRLRRAHQSSKRLRHAIWDVVKLVIAAVVGALGVKWFGKP